MIPLGGLGEVGKNMTVFEIGDETIVIDAGLAFPRDEHLGVDLILPDFGYLRDREVRAVVLTHAHEDHVGALPYLLREVHGPRDLGDAADARARQVEARRARPAARRRAERDRPGGRAARASARSSSSSSACRTRCPDAVGIAITTAAGLVFHTGDWKLDHTPVDGLRTDVGKLAELGNRGVDLLLGDSTNAERPGFTQSERVVGEAFRQIIPARQGRVLISSFASNIHRMQQAIDVAVEVDRKVAVVGRSMRKNLNIARNLGYIEVPEEFLVRPKDLDDVPPQRAADPLHRLAGRAALGADADRLQRPSGDQGRARRHRDHLGAARAGERAARPRLDQPAHPERRRGAARGERAGARLRATRARRSCARCSRSSGRRR